ncbi:MAG: M14 family metallopeptidase, partial [Acidobacteriota bacterium]
MIKFALSVAAAAALATSAAIAAVPTPASHFGHAMGVDRKLISWSQTVAYFNKLPAASDRIVVREIGKTTEGRPMIAAFISAPENLKQLARLQQNQKRLADPRTTSPEDAARIIAGHKAVVMITCSIHSTEVASTLTAVQFAYQILTESRPKYNAILKDVILILVPSLNPDGVDIVKNWYDKTLGTPYEGTSPPQLYQKYIGHDNNRDWYIFSQPETRNVVTQLHNIWHPQIVYDVHQQGPYGSRIFIPPWLDPIDPNVDPILAQSANMIGTGMAYDLTAAGHKGVVISASYDFWTPARHYQAYHGGMRILSESASVRLATPMTVRPDQINETSPGYLPRERSWNYLEPWLGGEWHIG